MSLFLKRKYERARAEYDQLRYDDADFADLYGDNDADFDEWYTEVYLVEENSWGER